ncbi:MAG: response regulator transcription factor [Anaerolineales bacterium]
MDVLIVDDHSLFRDGIVSLLEAAGHNVVGQIGNGEQAIELAANSSPDLILMDIQMPNMSGIEAMRRIKQDGSGTKVVMLTVSEDDDDLFAAAQAGADGYLLKNLDGEEFLELLAGLSRGEAAMTRKTAGRLLQRMSAAEAAPSNPQDVLTERESELLQQVALGLSNKEIASALSISENTVKFHVKNVLQKLNVSNRTEAVSVGIRKGLIDTSFGSPSDTEETHPMG